MWTKDQHAQSLVGGWRLVTTFNNGETHPYYDIVPQGDAFKTEREASLAVIDAAKRGVLICQEALRLVMASRVKPSPKGKR